MRDDRPPPKRFPPRFPSFHSTYTTPFIPPLFRKIPTELILWLIKDLSSSNIQTALSQPAFRQKLKGYRLHAVPADLTQKLLHEQFRRSIAFRVYTGKLWSQQKKDDFKSVDAVPHTEIINRYKEFTQKFGFTPFYWYCVYSKNVALQKLAPKLLEEFVSEQIHHVSRPTDPAEELAAKGDEQLVSEVQRLEEEVDNLTDDKEELETQLESQKRDNKSLLQETFQFKERLRESERTVQHIRNEESHLRGQIAGLEGKLRSLSDAEHTIKQMDKKNRSLEHDLSDLKDERDQLEKELEGVRKGNSSNVEMRGEMEKSLLTLFSIYQEISQKSNSQKRFSGEKMIVLAKPQQIPGAYYEMTSELGLSFLYHSGFKRNSELDRAIPNAWKVVLFLDRWDELSELSDILGYLRKQCGHYLVLPFLSPEAFRAFLTM